MKRDICTVCNGEYVKEGYSKRCPTCRYLNLQKDQDSRWVLKPIETVCIDTVTIDDTTSEVFIREIVDMLIDAMPYGSKEYIILNSIDNGNVSIKDLASMLGYTEQTVKIYIRNVPKKILMDRTLLRGLFGSEVLSDLFRRRAL